jgi:hypothetical protein
VLRITASPGYFSALGIDIVAGRPFIEGDTGSSSPVVVVSTACVRAMGLSVARALGTRINVGLDVGLDATSWATIVGVVRDVRMRGPESETTAALYVPFAQASVGPTAFLVVDGTANRNVLVNGIRAAVGRLDPNLPVYNVREFRDIRTEYLAARRFAMAMTSTFGVIVFAVACFGLNAIITYMVRRRTREIGVRLAIGATPLRIRRDVMWTGAGYAASGVAIGLVVVPIAQRLLAATIPGIVAIGHLNVAILGTVILTTATLAAWFPAARAARIDPVVALRTE